MVSSADWFQYISHFVFGLWKYSAFGHPNILAFLAFRPFLSGAPSQYNISEECPVLGVTKMQT